MLNIYVLIFVIKNFYVIIVIINNKLEKQNMAIEKETLYDLYVNQNMARFEVAEKLGVPESQVKRYLIVYKIKKPRDLYKICCSRIAKQKGGHTTGKKWYNNGVVETLAEECPEGFVAGKLRSTAEKIGKALKGRTYSEETIKKMSQKARGKKLSEETKKKISAYVSKHPPMLGKKHTDEARRKIKEARARQILKAPLQEKINAFENTHTLSDYQNKKGIIDVQKICDEIGIQNDCNTRKRIYGMYDKNGINYSFGANHISENKLREWIESFYTGEIVQGSRKILPGCEIDLFFPSANIAIEYNGCYWHSVSKGMVEPNYHYNKSILCREKGIRLIHIWEDQWKDKRLQPILKQIIKAALKVPTGQKKIYARKCQLKEIDKKTYEDYCNAHHTQKSKPAKIMLGLFYEGELVQVASFNPYNSRNGRKAEKVQYDYEFCRGCEAFNHSRVIGGVSKLFSYFVNKYNPSSVLCYSDFNLFCGNGYAACGFELDGFTGPDKFYIDEMGVRIPRRANKYKEYKENVDSGKWLLCYGAGSLRFVWRKSGQDKVKL